MVYAIYLHIYIYLYIYICICTSLRVWVYGIWTAGAEAYPTFNVRALGCEGRLRDVSDANVGAH